MAHTSVNPDGWAPAKGYANAMLTPEGHLFLGGQIGWNAAQEFEHSDFVGQLGQVLRNIAAIVEKAGGGVTDITRMTWFITDKREYMKRQREVGEVYRAVMGRHFPAMSVVVVAGLIEDEALIEIEATAVLEKPAPA